MMMNYIFILKYCRKISMWWFDDENADDDNDNDDEYVYLKTAVE